MRSIDSKFEIVNQRLDEINRKVEEKIGGINLDNRFDEIFSGRLRNNSNNTVNNPQASIEQILKQMNSYNNFNNFNILGSFDKNSIIEFRGFKMKAEVAAKFIELEKMIKQYFPGREVIITSGMDGKHMPNSAHYRGEALDFVVEPLTPEESKIIEKLAEKAGFKVYNEYLYDSPYKTGPHMHIQL